MPMAFSSEKYHNRISLTDEQHDAVETISDIFSRSKKTTLIYGVTGSGKTEVYIRVIQRV